MEPVSLVVGLLPIAGLTLKASKSVHKKLKIIRHHVREIRHFQKLIDRQRHFFTNEIHLLLRAVVDDESSIELMLKDSQHENWKSPNFEAGMRKTLGRNYDACKEAIEDVGSTIKIIQEEFDHFDESVVDSWRDGSSKEAMRRYIDRVKLSFNESKIDKSIQDLRHSNNDLRRLREQAQELSRGEKSSLPSKPRGQLTIEYGNCYKVKRASKALYEALSQAWETLFVTGTAPNLRHTVRLFLNTRVNEEIQMELAISCCGHGMRGPFDKQRLTSVLVRSQILSWLEPSPSASLSLNEPINSGQGGRKRRKVRFTEPAPSEKLSPLRSVDTQMAGCVDMSPTDLCSKNICAIFSSLDNARSTFPHGSVLGYLDSCSQEKFRHSFYRNIQSAKPGRAAQMGRSVAGLMSVRDILSHQAEKSVNIIDQFKLARDLALTVLKFHSTPWLREYFTLRDLSFFTTSTKLPECLQTLHVTQDFFQSPSIRTCLTEKSVDEASMRDSTYAETSGTMELAKYQYGVRNLTLWSLGTALLEIGRWSRLENLDDVPSVRRAAVEVLDLGPKYRDLTKKCLECDFGYGDDLAKPRLQQAVYENLVCELTDMVRSLEVDEG